MVGRCRLRRASWAIKLEIELWGGIIVVTRKAILAVLLWCLESPGVEQGGGVPSLRCKGWGAICIERYIRGWPSYIRSIYVSTVMRRK